MSDDTLSEAERELVELYGEKTAEAYAKGELRQADHHADNILRYAPNDLYARFIKGAVVGRFSTPEALHVEEAFAYWKPLVAQAQGDERIALLEAVAPAFTLMTNTPLELGIRRWDTCREVAATSTLAEDLTAYLALSTSLVDDPAVDAWITNLFLENYAMWVARVIPPSTPIPTQTNMQTIDSFYEMVHAAYEVAKRMPAPLDARCTAIRRRALSVLARFSAINLDARHPEREDYLAAEQAAFPNAATTT